jgi:hypothetical protein
MNAVADTCGKLAAWRAAMGRLASAALVVALVAGGCHLSARSMADTYGSRFAGNGPVVLHARGRAATVGPYQVGQTFQHWREHWPLLVGYYLAFVATMVVLKRRGWLGWARAVVFGILAPFAAYHLMVCGLAALVFD